MTEFLDPEERLAALIDAAAPKLRRRFLETVRQIRDRFTLAQLENLLVRGQVDEALRFAEVSAAHFGGAWSEVFMSTADETALFIRSRLDLPLAFNLANQRAVDAIQSNQLRLIREFTQEQRISTRTALRSAVSRGVNPRVAAREIKSSIGLTSRQVQYVENYRDALTRGNRDALTRRLRDARFDRTVQRAAETGELLSFEQIDRMVDRYRERWLQFRAETISRTEALTSVHEGAEEMYSQAIESGQISADELESRWNTAKDEKVRSSHSAMHDQVRPIGEPFLSGNGTRLRYPGDPTAPASDRVRCRCAVSRRFTDSAVADLQVPDLQVQVLVGEEVS